ncbi:MAG TPA: methyltransferase domain-containing protein, partial [Candidatus Acidoferrales bacterium]|nr:methyltransferase domain-containing protein [Candidatus Acidoferrales bacterium]
MNRDLVEWLACPTDRSHRLQLHAAAEGDHVEAGELSCQTCSSAYPIVGGIPMFLTTEYNRLSQLQQHEKEAREDEYARGERYISEVARLPQLDAVGAALGDCRGLRILDAGCGKGEVTSVARAAARIVAFDFAWSGLIEHCLRRAATVDLIQADACRMPLRDGIFDAVISTELLQHFASREQRAAFLAHLGRVLKPGGRLVLTTSNWNSYQQRAGVPQQGFFGNGIFRRHFQPSELRAELEPHFDIEELLPVQIYLPKTYRLVQSLGKNAVHWDRFWRRRSLSFAYSDHLLAQCRRRRGA